MFKALAEGIVWGLILSLMLGPVFFGLLHTSIHKGFQKAIVYASGVASSDSFFIIITYFGIAGFMDDQGFIKIMMAVGGFIMAAFGLYYFFKKASDTIELEKEKKQSFKSNMWLKGFFLNSINPSVFIFWIGMVSFASVNYHNDRLYIFIFFASAILTVFGADTLKAYIANKIKIYFTNRLLNKMNKVLGLVIFIAGLSLIYDFYKHV
jgi:threonine/homoserine/homoserine lactone efflux protein